MESKTITATGWFFHPVLWNNWETVYILLKWDSIAVSRLHNARFTCSQLPTALVKPWCLSSVFKPMFSPKPVDRTRSWTGMIHISHQIAACGEEKTAFIMLANGDMTGRQAYLTSLRLYDIIITGPQVDPGLNAMIIVRVQLELGRFLFDSFDRMRTRINITSNCNLLCRWELLNRSGNAINVKAHLIEHSLEGRQRSSV